MHQFVPLTSLAIALLNWFGDGRPWIGMCHRICSHESTPSFASLAAILSNAGPSSVMGHMTGEYASVRVHRAPSHRYEGLRDLRGDGAGKRLFFEAIIGLQLRDLGA